MTVALRNSKWFNRTDLILIKFQTLLSKLKTKPQRYIKQYTFTATVRTSGEASSRVFLQARSGSEPELPGKVGSVSAASSQFKCS